MEVCHSLTKTAISCHTLEQLEPMLTQLRQHYHPIRHFEHYENEAHALFVQAECEVLANDRASLDDDAPAIELNRQTKTLEPSNSSHPNAS